MTHYTTSNNVFDRTTYQIRAAFFPLCPFEEELKGELLTYTTYSFQSFFIRNIASMIQQNSALQINCNEHTNAVEQL